MSKTRIVLIVLLILSAVVYYFRTDLMYRYINYRTGGFSNMIPKASTLKGTNLKEFAQSYHEAYRLKPDKRVIQSVAIIDQIISGQQPAPPQVHYQDGTWQIVSHGVNVGTLPELSHFKDQMNFLTGWALALLQKTPLNGNGAEGADLVFGELERKSPKTIFAYLGRLNQRWLTGEKRVGDVANAARAYLWLVLYGEDALEVSDNISRALGLIALSEALGTDMTREKALVADLFQFGAFALELTKKLDADDTVALYIKRVDEQLELKANRPGAEREAHFFWLRRLVQNYDLTRWQEFSKKFVSEDGWLLFMQSVVGLNSFELNQKFSAVIINMFMWACVGELAPDEAYQKYLGAMTEKPATGIEPDLIERIHQVSGDAVYAQQRPMKELLDARQVPSGPFVNSQIVNEFYRNFYFSILHRMGMYVLEQLSSIDAAKLFAQQLQQALAQDEVGRDMASWFGSLCLLEVRVSGPIMAEDYFNFTRLGPTAAVRVYKKLTKYLSFGDAAFGVATEQLLQRLDDRIENRHYLSRFAIDLLNDVFLYRRLVPNYKDEVVRNYPYDSAYDAYLNKDYQKIYDLLSVATGEKGNLIKLISKGEGIDVEKVIDLWKGAVKERPDAVGLAQGYAEFLMEQKQYAQAREVITAWLKISQPKDLQLVHSMNLIAKSYLLEGEYQKGYDAIAPHLEVGQNYSFLLAGQLLAKLNRFDEAKLIFLKAIDRYPGYFKTVMPYVKICWEHGKFEEAAQLLSQHAKLIRIEDWRWIVGKEFAEVFAELPLAKAQQAISFLVTNNISGYALRELAIALKNKEHYELALDVLDKVHVSGLGQVQADLDAYFILRKTKSDSEALTWLRGRLGGMKDINPASVMFFEAKDYTLLWDIIDKPEKGSGPDFIWLMRAAAYCLDEKKTDAQRDALLAYYQKHDSSHYDIVGQYLMGLIDQAQAIAVATDLKKVTEVSYYLGVKDQGQGKLESSSDWYRISVATGLTNNGEYRWAFAQLYNWANDLRNQKILLDSF